MTRMIAAISAFVTVGMLGGCAVETYEDCTSVCTEVFEDCSAGCDDDDEDCNITCEGDRDVCFTGCEEEDGEE